MNRPCEIALTLDETLQRLTAFRTGDEAGRLPIIFEASRGATYEIMGLRQELGNDGNPDHIRLYGVDDFDPFRDLLVWWTDQADTDAIGVDSLAFIKFGFLGPNYICRQYHGRCGRAGRGRLWIDDQFSIEAIPWNHGSPFAARAAVCAGIVFHRNDFREVAKLPGFVTDCHLNKVVSA